MNETSIALPQNQQVTADEIRKFIVGNKTFERVPKPQIDIAIETAKAYNLNPFKREVHFTPYNGELKIIVGYEVYLKRAEATRKLNGWKVEIQGQGSDMKAVATIYRKDWEYPFVHEAYKVEVAQNTPIWTKMPRFMLKKVAIGQAFRLAFPEEMGGMPYLEDELPDLGISPSIPITAEQSVIKELKDEDVSEQPQEAMEDVTPTCNVCGKTLTPKVAGYSKNKLGKYLCTIHQKPPASSQTSPPDMEASQKATTEQKNQIRQFIADGIIPAQSEEKIENISFDNATKLIERVASAL